jgi:hypothetical protein
MGNREHLPFELIKDFAYGDASLDELELHHCYSCEECSEIWAAFQREVQVIKRARALRGNAEADIARLLEESLPKIDKKSA